MLRFYYPATLDQLVFIRSVWKEAIRFAGVFIFHFKNASVYAIKIYRRADKNRFGN